MSFSAGGILADGKWAFSLQPAPVVPGASPVTNAVVIVCVMAIGAGLMGYLYLTQLKLAARKIVLWLTGIRAAILLLLLVLLFQPAVKFVSNTTTNGTLWLLLDQSRSMGLTDPQATPIERLRWADALNLLPNGTRRGKADYWAAHLIALRESLARLEPAASAGLVPDADATAKYAGELKAWQTKFEKASTAMGDDAVVSGPGATVLSAVARTVSNTSDSIRQAAVRQTIHDAARAINWAVVENDLALESQQLLQIADAEDAKILQRATGNADVDTALAKVATMSRADLATAMLVNRKKSGGATISGLYGKYRTKVASVADGAQTVGPLSVADPEETLKTAFAISGNSTNLTAGFSLLGESIGAEEPASIIVVSDGRHNGSGDPTEASRLLAARGISVFGLTMGSSQVSPDAAVEQPDAPDWIYKDDTLTASATVRLDGLSGVPLRVDFLRDGDVIDSTTVAAASNQESQHVVFKDKPPEVKGYEYAIKVAEAPREVNTQNNVQMFHVAVKKDKLFVLYVDDVPRWEYRYLVSALGRDQRVKLQTVLLRPARVVGVVSEPATKASVSNPRIEAQLLPETKEEWQGFDVIMLGDVPLEKLPAQQQQWIAAAVRDRGTTLIAIAGQRHMPAEYGGTPLAELLPVTPGEWDDGVIAAHLHDGFRPGLAPEGNASVLTQLGLDPDSNSSLWAHIPNWYWHSTWTLAKPAASVEWTITEPAADVTSDASRIAVARKRALLSSVAIGSGKTLFLASDQSWRLRQVNGEEIHSRFWGSVLRWAVGSDLPAGGKFVRFGAGRPTYTTNDAVVITARILKEDLSPYTGLGFRVQARDKGGKVVTEAEVTEAQGSPGYYRATLTNLPAGRIDVGLAGAEVERLLAVDPSVSSKTLVLNIMSLANVEDRNMNTDRAGMERLARAGMGIALDGPYADVLAEYIPAITRTLTSSQTVGFFGDPQDRWTQSAHALFLVLFVALISAEWIVRKAGGMV